jgi:AcrR family transcriptional regulator
MDLDSSYDRNVPKLWTETIESHRREVHEAIVEAAGGLANEVGITSVTMSDVAERAGIGRATLYKYFPSVEAILHAWAEKQISSHLDHLRSVRERGGTPVEQLRAVLTVYAHISQAHGASEVAASVHQGDHAGQARGELQGFLEEILREGVETGGVRADVPVAELATFCLHTASTASALTTKHAANRLVKVILAGLRPS